MMNNIYILTLILTLTSCSDFFIKDLEIPRQELEKQLVVHSFVADSDSTLLFQIEKNFGLDDEFDISESKIDQATVDIYSDGNLLYHIKQDPVEKTYALSMENNFGSLGNSFSFEINHPDYDKALVTAEIPPYAGPESIRFIPEFRVTPDNQDKKDALEIKITDPADQENYYEIQVHQVVLDSSEYIFGEDTFVYETKYPDSYMSRDPIIDQGISGLLISDQSFNGLSYTFYILLDSYAENDSIPVDKLRVSWNCISKDHYEYAKSLLKYQNGKDFGLFRDPIAVYSNVENGQGIISLRSTKILPVEE